MIHRTYFSPLGATSDRLQSMASAAALNDQRTEVILHGTISLPDDKWAVHKVADLWISAADALTARLVTEIGDFAPPKGNHLFSVSPA